MLSTLAKTMGSRLQLHTATAQLSMQCGQIASCFLLLLMIIVRPAMLIVTPLTRLSTTAQLAAGMACARSAGTLPAPTVERPAPTAGLLDLPGALLCLIWQQMGKEDRKSVCCAARGIRACEGKWRLLHTFASLI